jgi:hypothetical protein
MAGHAHTGCVFSPIFPLLAGANPCEHLGRCVNTQGSFLCQCGRGYTGPRCETDVNECLSGPCRNQATCLDRIGQFTCICMAGGWWVWLGWVMKAGAWGKTWFIVIYLKKKCWA